MIVTENATMYTCDHCRKKYWRKQDIIKHEFGCSSNPKNFSACSGCVHLEEIKVEYPAYYDNDYGQAFSVKESKGFFCKKLQQKMYPFKAEKKGLVKKYPGTFMDQVKMPTECHHYSEGDNTTMLNGVTCDDLFDQMGLQ